MGEARNGPPPRTPLTFVELWNNITYYDTNNERKGFASILARLEGKVGLNVADTPLQVYGVYYGTVSQDSNYWNNSVFSGLGARYRPFDAYQASGWHDEWINGVKIFVESLSPSYGKNAASAEAAGLATSDLRYGFDVWHEWNQENPDLNQLWGEMWANLSYRQTNFGWEDFSSYVLYWEPKIGRHLGNGVGVYTGLDLVYSRKSGASYSFLNIASYGVGLRIQPWRNAQGANEIFKKFFMYAEFLAVSYLKQPPTDPNRVVSSDVRFGIDFAYGR
ncbi:MAG: hypothetical protein ABH823_03985 [bacterium]